MNDIELTVLNKFRSLLTEKLSVHKMILFGSRAKGSADPYSDMDLVVILDGLLSEEIKEYVSDCAWEAGFGHGIVLVPVVFARDEWENGPERYSLFVQTVETEGLPL